MPTTLPMFAEQGHIMVHLDDGTALIDTGSPFSFSTIPVVFAGIRYNLPQHFPGNISPAMLSSLLGFRIDCCIGTDILTQAAIRIRWHEQCIDIGDDLPDGEVKLPLQTLHGCPAFPVSIGDTQTNALLDTGANLSYVDPILVEGLQPIGHKEDVHPMSGSFITPIYPLDTSVATGVVTLQYGVLPDILRQPLQLFLQEIDGRVLIGTELFRHFDCTIAWNRKTISWTHSGDG